MKSLSLKYTLIIAGGVLLALASLWFIPGPDRQGAMVYVEPNRRMSQQGQEWTAKVWVESNVPINAADVVVKYPADLVEINEVGVGQTRFETSVFKPTYDPARAEARFVAATLEPYIGKKALLGEIEFRAKKPGESVVEVVKATVVGHDGQGTDVYHQTLRQSVGGWLAYTAMTWWE